MENSKRATQLLAKTYADRGDPNGWFEAFYTKANGDIHKVYWADLSPNPLLLDWIEQGAASTQARAITILTGQIRVQAVAAIAKMVAPGGEILVSCRSRTPGEEQDTFPLALDRDEIDGFQRAGLTERHFAAYNDDQDEPVPHFFAVYKRPV